MSIAAVSSVAVSSYGSGQPAPPPVVPAPTAEASPGLAIGQPNPTIQLDPAVNVVVTQLHNRQGELVSSIPTERHLQAYRIGLLPVPSSSAPAIALPAAAQDQPDPAPKQVVAATPSTPVVASLAPAAAVPVPSAVQPAARAAGGSVHADVTTLAVAASPLPALAPTVATPVTSVTSPLPSNQISTAARSA